MKTSSLTLFLVLALVIPCAHAQTSGVSKAPEEPTCKCEPLKTVTAAYEFADVVFTGKVLRVVPPSKGREKLDTTKIVFEVLQFWKGDLGHQYTLVRTDAVHPECNFPFERGKEYLVYVDQTLLDVSRERFVPGGDKVRNATRCSRTKLLEGAERDIVVLGPGEFPE